MSENTLSVPPPPRPLERLSHKALLARLLLLVLGGGLLVIALVGHGGLLAQMQVSKVPRRLRV
jgi:hypothetical protein